MRQIHPRVNKRTGKIKVKLGGRSVKTVIAQVRTRRTEWILTPKRTLPVAVAMAQARFVAMMGAELAA